MKSHHARKVSRLLFELYFSQPWMRDREKQIKDIVSRLNSDEEIEYFLSFAKRFTYVDSARIPLVIDQMAEIIANDTNFSPDETQIVATAYDSQPDSSQLILQQIKSRLPQHGWSSAKLVNQTGKIFSNLKTHFQVILIDEFAGTGSTILNRIDYIMKSAKNHLSAGKELQIHVVLAFAMNRALKNIREKSINVSSTGVLDAAISEKALPEKLDREVYLMKTIESYLKHDILGHKKPFPSFGYGGAEALYAMEHNNVPNSVFPIIWWRYATDGSEIDPILYRHDENFP